MINNAFQTPAFKHFSKGDFAQVVLFRGKKDSPWIIGAYAFQGRLNEAEALYEEKKDKLDEMAKVIARFYLAITNIRHGNNKKGQYYLKLNNEVKKAHEIVNFFRNQGLGFSHFFAGDFTLSEAFAKNAYQSALKLNLKYALFLSLDLRGHCLVELGQVVTGLTTLNHALKVILDLGDSKNAQSLHYSILIKTSYYGIKGNLLPELQNAVRSVSTEDTYSKSSLLLEIARQYMLRGNLKAAELALDDATQVFYATGNIRHKTLVNFSRAYLNFRAGKGYLALSMIQAIKASKEYDQALERKIIGLENKILSTLGLHPTELPTHVKSSSQNEDLVGNLIDQIKLGSEEAPILCLKKGYWGLLYECFQISFSNPTLIFGLTPKSLTVFDGGNVHHISGLTTLQLKLLKCMLGDQGSLDKMVTTIWGQEYHPLRHDNLVYRAISQLKKILGKSAYIIQRDERKYSLAQVFTVKNLDSAHAKRPELIERMPLQESEFTHRQLMLLKWFQKGQDRVTDIQGVKKMFKISTMSAYRDLKLLCEKKKLKALGKARATKYIALT
ncbi:MAG: hypothetical protein ACOYL6_15315 [Bacteriovoracaceae bacterium]